MKSNNLVRICRVTPPFPTRLKEFCFWKKCPLLNFLIHSKTPQQKMNNNSSIKYQSPEKKKQKLTNEALDNKTNIDKKHRNNDSKE